MQEELDGELGGPQTVNKFFIEDWAPKEDDDADAKKDRDKAKKDKAKKDAEDIADILRAH